MRRDSTLILLTFLGMVGLYVGAAYVYTKYQAYRSDLEKKGTVGTLFSILSGN